MESRGQKSDLDPERVVVKNAVRLVEVRDPGALHVLLTGWNPCPSPVGLAQRCAALIGGREGIFITALSLRRWSYDAAAAYRLLVLPLLGAVHKAVKWVATAGAAVVAGALGLDAADVLRDVRQLG